MSSVSPTTYAPNYGIPTEIDQRQVNSGNTRQAALSASSSRSCEQASFQAPVLSFDKSRNKLMVELATNELIKEGWDGRDQTVFQFFNEEKRVLMTWKSCTFALEDFVEIQQLVLEKLSRSTAEKLSRADSKISKGKVQVRSSNNDDDGSEVNDHIHLQEINVLSGKPTLKEVLVAVTSAKEDGTQAIAHLLEHFNKNWLFKLYDTTKNAELLAILGQKIEIRLEFEKSLRLLELNSTTTQRPSCFICFALEPDVSAWLEKVFVPDLELVDVDPIFCLKQFGPGKELNAFQAMIRTTNKVVIICTPLLKQSCEDRQRSPTGSAQEIRLAKERYNDKDKYETIFPVFLKGERNEALPDHFFEPILGTVLNPNGNVVWSYYAQAFELFAEIRGIERSVARKIKESFFNKVETVLEKQDFSFDQLQQKSQCQDSETALRVKGIFENTTRKIKNITLPPYPIDFTGRNEELQQLKRLYESGVRHVAVVGQSGVGKSALALAFAHQSKQRFDFIYALQVSEQAPLRQGLLKLANDLSLLGTDEERLDGLKKWLKDADNKHLILLDNLDDSDQFEELKEFIDLSGGCCFLLTSVMTEHCRRLGFTSLLLHCLEPDDAVAFLEKATLIKGLRLPYDQFPAEYDKHGRKELARELCYLPRALARAADYMRATHSSASNFLEKYQAEELHILSNNFPQSAHTSMVPWRIFLKKIQKKMNGNNSAVQVLLFFSLERNVSISRRELQFWSDKTRFSSDLDSALCWLLEYALIGSRMPDYYYINPFVYKEISRDLNKAITRKSFLYNLNFEKHVFFEKNANELDNPLAYEGRLKESSELEKPITAAINLLRKDNFVHLNIEGHSDSIETVDTRNKISEERARYVKRLIVRNSPTFENRISVRGIGSTNAVDASEDPGHERNRVAVIRIDVERSMNLEDYLPITSLPSILRMGLPPIDASSFDTTSKDFFVEVVKIKFYSLNFARFIFFSDNKEELTNPADYEGYLTGTEIERPLTAARNLLLRYPFIHLTIEGHKDDNSNSEQTRRLCVKRSEYLKEVIVKNITNDAHAKHHVVPFDLASRIKTTEVGAPPLDTSDKPILSRNRVAIIRIDIEKSTAWLLSSPDDTTQNKDATFSSILSFFGSDTN